MSNVADFSQIPPFRPHFGAFYPIRLTNQRPQSGTADPLFGSQETWLAPNVLWDNVLPPRPPRSTTPGQRGQVSAGPSPAGDCQTPTTELEKTERGPISTIGTSIA